MTTQTFPCCMIEKEWRVFDDSRWTQRFMNFHPSYQCMIWQLERSIREYNQAIESYLNQIDIIFADILVHWHTKQTRKTKSGYVVVISD